MFFLSLCRRARERVYGNECTGRVWEHKEEKGKKWEKYGVYHTVGMMLKISIDLTPKIFQTWPRDVSKS